MVAVLVASLGFAGAAISLGVNGYLERRRLFAEQLAVAFDRFKETQRRSAGVASLAGLRASSPRFWRDHDEAVTDFLYAQSVYLLCEGGNRFKAHEIVNLRQMLDWITSSTTGHAKLEEWQRYGLIEAATAYLKDAMKEGLITNTNGDSSGPGTGTEATEDWAVKALRSRLNELPAWSRTRPS